MDIIIFLKEFGRLLYKEKLIILLSVVISIIIANIGLLLSNSDSQSTDDIDSTAVMGIYIEQNFIGTYINSDLIEVLMTREEVVNNISKDTGVDIQASLDKFAENNVPIDSEEDPINVERNTSSHIMNISINIGTEEENINVLRAYDEWLKDNEDPFFEDKNVFFVNQPSIKQDQLLNNQTDGVSAKRYILMSTIGLFVGVIIGVTIGIIKAWTNKKINYSFVYGWNPKDIYFKENNDSTNSKLAHDLVSGLSKNKVILTQYDLDSELKNKMHSLESKLLILHDLTELKVNQTIDEVVILIEKNTTEKKWYNQQRRLLELYPEVRVKLIET